MDRSEHAPLTSASASPSTPPAPPSPLHPSYQVLLLDEFRKQGVVTIFLQGPSGHTAEDELLVQVQGMIAEYERAKILERSRRGKLYRARQGSINVLGGAPYGYLYIKKTDQSPASYRVLLPQAKVVRQIFRSLAHEQMSIGQISRDLNAAQVETPAGARQWNRSTICNIAMNPAYIGKAAFGKTESVESNETLRPRRGSKGISKHHTTQRPRPEAQWISIDVPSIVSREVFEAAQEQIARNRKLSPRNGRSRHLLQGLTVCRLCGYSFCGASTNRSPAKGGAVYTYYRCAGSEGPRFAGGAVCDNCPVRAQPLEEHVWNAVTDVLLNPSRIFEEWSRRQKHHGAPAELQERRDDAMRTLATHQRGLQRLVDAYEIGAVDLNELKTRSDAARTRIQRARREAEDAELALQKSGQLRLVIARVDDFATRLTERLNDLSWQERRQIIRMLVERIEIDESGASIVFRVPTTDIDPAPMSAASADSEETATQQSYGLRTGRNGHLTLECNPQRFAGKLAPQGLFRFRTIVPHEMSTLSEQRLEFELVTSLGNHEDLRCPANQLGFAPHGAKSVTRASRHSRVPTARGADVAPPSGDRLMCWAVGQPCVVKQRTKSRWVTHGSVTQAAIALDRNSR